MLGVRVLVYGAANGIGEAIARTCVQQDARVIAVDAAVTDVESRFRNVAGIDGIAMPLDDARAVIEAAAERMDGLDVVILSADLQPKRPINDAEMQDTFTREQLARLQHCFVSALPYLKKSPGGRIVALGMLRSAFARDAQILRANSEQALAKLVRDLAADAGEYGITVNYVQPGGIMTNESRGVFKSDKELRDSCIQHSAARRLGEALEVAKAVLFLASDDATFVSGSGIKVDGGRAS